MIGRTPNQVAEFIQTAFTFNDDDEVIGVDVNTHWQWIFGSDYVLPGFKDHDDIRADMNGFYKAVKSLATRIYGQLPY